MENAETKKRLGRRALIVACLVVVMLVAASVWYFSDYSHADAHALAAMESTDKVEVAEVEDCGIVFTPRESGDAPHCGIVFYPGAKVEPKAYAPLMKECAERGALCVVVEPPLNFALFNVDAAADVTERIDDVDCWIVAGHSLGGVAAGNCIATHDGMFDGLVLLASFPDSDLSDFDGGVLSIYGENDGVLNREKYEAGFSKLPTDTSELVIIGGNHAQFGDYGAQDNDGKANISSESQQEQTVEAIVEFADKLAA